MGSRNLKKKIGGKLGLGLDVGVYLSHSYSI